MKLYQGGADRIEDEFDIHKIVKQLRYVNVIVDRLIKDPIGRFKIDNTDRNFIRLDTDDSLQSFDKEEENSNNEIYETDKS